MRLAQPVTRREALLIGAGVGAALVFPRIPAQAADSTCFGWPADAGSAPVLPYPTIFQETQCWWMNGNTGLSAPGANFAHDSWHVHAGIASPTGERLLPMSDGFFHFPCVLRLHNFQGGKGRFFRGGAVPGLNPGGSGIPQIGLTAAMQNPQSADVMQTGLLKIPNGNPPAGQKELRFSLFTFSPTGKEMYQSGAWYTFVGTTPSAVGAVGRGWYVGAEYTNIGVGTKYRASAPLRAGQTISYSRAAGANWAFAYADPDIHHGSKGTVIFENRTADGTFVIPAGTKVLMVGAWEKRSDGWNAGVLRLPLA
jgi:hypothetical protein